MSFTNDPTEIVKVTPAGREVLRQARDLNKLLKPVPTKKVGQHIWDRCILDQEGAAYSKEQCLENVYFAGLLIRDKDSYNRHINPMYSNNDPPYARMITWIHAAYIKEYTADLKQLLSFFQGKWWDDKLHRNLFWNHGYLAMLQKPRNKICRINWEKRISKKEVARLEAFKSARRRGKMKRSQ